MFLNKTNYGGAFIDESANLDDAMVECAVGVERAWGEMMMECCAMEFKAYQESGDIGAVNEGVIESIKKWFKKVWNAIKNFFGKAITVVRSKTMSCQQFHEKYKKEIDAGLPKIKEFKGFKYDLGKEFKADSIAISVINNISTIEKENEKDEDAKKAIIGAIASQAGFEAADKTEDLMKNAQKKWQGGTTDKVTLDSDTMSKAVSDIKTDVYVKNLALQLKMTENTIKNMQTEAEKVYKGKEDDNEQDSRKKTRLIAFIRIIVSALVNLNTKYGKMANAVADQTMAIMRAAISASKKKDESASISTNEAMEYLRSQGIEF